jgi:hyperosmotically inducible protein
MAFPKRVPLAAVLLSFTLLPRPSVAQATQPGPAFSQEDTVRIAEEVRKRLLKLPNYSVFDDLRFGIQGKTLVLLGYASRPILKSEAGNTVKGIEGIQNVQNNIEVLPNSPNDDRIRAAVYNRIYTQPALRKYNANAGTIGRAIGPGSEVAIAAGGITNSPPIGYHSIHIIVKGGNVILTGAVDSKSDADIANIQANGTPGVFSVTNDLNYPGKAGQAK